MTEKYYSSRTVHQFIKNTLCEKDPVTYKHYLNDNVNFFQKRLKNPDSIEQTVYVECTNILRDIIYEIIDDLTEHMKDWGDLIITGGEAFNTYFDMNDRIVSSDIDTKFVPRFLTPFDKKFFGYLQVCKLILWNRLGFICKKFNDKFRERIKILSKTKIGKLLSIKVPNEKEIFLKRRYTLMKKSKIHDVLIDVELFALDLDLKYFSPQGSPKKLGGILDIPIMRPYEIGYEVAFTRERGVHVVNPTNDDIIYFKNILIASKLFLIEDLFIMKKLGLRPKKIKKDRKRLLRFSKKVLKINDIDSRTPDEKIFEKSVKVIEPYPIIKLVTEPIKSLPTRVPSPLQYNEYTTVPNIHAIKKIIVPGIKTKKFEHIQDFEKTNSNMYFDRKTQTWKKSKNPHYVRNIYDFRPVKETYTSKPQKLVDTLYGYLKQRNDWVPSQILKKSATIPLVGLKNTDIDKLIK